MYKRASVAFGNVFLCALLGAAVTALLLFFSGPVSAELNADIPGLCYNCHGATKGELSLPVVHAPFRQGKCNSCHDPHAAQNKGLLSAAVNKQCLGCHEKLGKSMKEENLHGALVKGACTDCHKAHASTHRGLLVTEEKNVCWKCHEGLKGKFNSAVVHVPFKEGKCTACHSPHSSAEDAQLLANSNKICKSCHTPQCKVGSVSIASQTSGMDCVSCHGGHTSPSKGLLGPFGHSAFLEKRCGECHFPVSPGSSMRAKAEGRELCFTCHQKDPAKFREGDVHLGSGKNACATCHLSHAANRKTLTINETKFCAGCHQGTVKRIETMVRVYAPLRCTPVREKKCFECHAPAHSLQPSYIRGDNIMVCQRCHTGQHKVSHPIGANVIDPRNGQPMHCQSCHSMHSPKADFMLIADRKRQLCIQCHKGQ